MKPVTQKSFINKSYQKERIVDKYLLNIIENSTGFYGESKPKYYCSYFFGIFEWINTLNA